MFHGTEIFTYIWLKFLENDYIYTYRSPMEHMGFMVSLLSIQSITCSPSFVDELLTIVIYISAGLFVQQQHQLYVQVT